MQATITYLLTEQAQREQMAATGQPIARKQTHIIEVTAEDLPYLYVREDGTASRDLQSGYVGSKSPIIDATTPEEAWRIYVDLQHAKEAERLAAGLAAEAARDAAIQSYLAGKEEPIYEQINDWMAFHGCNSSVTHEHAQYDAVRGKWVADRERAAAQKRATELAVGEDLYQQLLATPGASPYRDPVDAYGAGAVFPDMGPGVVCRCLPDWHPRRVEWVSELRARKQAAEDAKVAVAQAKVDYIAAWVARHPDEALRQQYADGLLCRTDATALIADQALDACLPKAADDMPTCESWNCPCGEKTVTCIPRRLYPTWRDIRAKLPDGYDVEFRRRRDCERGDRDDDMAIAGPETAGLKYWVAKITIPVGPFHFERTIRLG